MSFFKDLLNPGHAAKEAAQKAAREQLQVNRDIAWRQACAWMREKYPNRGDAMLAMLVTVVKEAKKRRKGYSTPDGLFAPITDKQSIDHLAVIASALLKAGPTIFEDHDASENFDGDFISGIPFPYTQNRAFVVGYLVENQRDSASESIRVNAKSLGLNGSGQIEVRLTWVGEMVTEIAVSVPQDEAVERVWYHYCLSPNAGLGVCVRGELYLGRYDTTSDGKRVITSERLEQSIQLLAQLT